MNRAELRAAQRKEEALANAEMEDIRDWAVLLAVWVFFFLLVPSWLAP